MRKPAFIEGVLAIVTLASSSPAQITPSDPFIPNALGNGGFETWSLGVSDQGPNPPDLWYADGTTDKLFQQGQILYSQVGLTRSDVHQGASGFYAVEITALNPGHFMSQSLENFAEYKGQWVTFSVRCRSVFSDAHPVLEINDGVSASQNNSTEASPDAFSRFSVTHRVSESATMLQVRIFPDQTVQLDEAAMTLGSRPMARFIPRPNPEPALMQLPLGAVIDWWRPNGEIPVPEGFAIADGSPIAIVDSPFFGLKTVDLKDRFVLGATSTAGIGIQGGASTVDLTHNHYMYHTHSGTTGQSDSNGFNFWIAPGGAGKPALDDHRHSFTTGGPSTNYTNNALSSVSILPPYVGLLKIVRVK